MSKHITDGLRLRFEEYAANNEWLPAVERSLHGDGYTASAVDAAWQAWQACAAQQAAVNPLETLFDLAKQYGYKLMPILR